MRQHVVNDGGLPRFDHERPPGQRMTGRYDQFLARPGDHGRGIGPERRPRRRQSLPFGPAPGAVGALPLGVRLVDPGSAAFLHVRKS